MKIGVFEHNESRERAGKILPSGVSDEGLPGRSDRARQISETTGTVALYLFSFSAVLSISLAQLSMALMLVSFIAQWRAVGRALRSEPLAWLAGGWVLYMALSASIGVREFPATASHQLLQARDWAQLALVVVPAWHFRADLRRFTIAAALFAFGAVLRVLVHLPWDNLGAFFAGQIRDGDTLGFGLRQISFSSYLAVVLLWLTVFAPRISRQLRTRQARIAFSLLAFAAGLIAFEGVIIGSSRGTWLATMIAFGVLAWRCKPWARPTRRTWLSVSLGVMAAVALIVATHGVNFLARVTIDQQVYAQIIEGDVPDAATELTSTGIRVQMWVHGIEKWLERPLLGWGAGSEQVLLQQLKPVATLVEHNAGRIPHTHNLLVELLMRFGVAGTMLFALFFGLVGWRLRALSRHGEIASDTYSFFFAFFVFVTVWSMFDIRIMRWDYRHFLFVYFGMAVSLAWTALRAVSRSTPSPAAPPADKLGTARES